jgi:hypothetical protein
MDTSIFIKIFVLNALYLMHFYVTWDACNELLKRINFP